MPTVPVASSGMVASPLRDEAKRVSPPSTTVWAMPKAYWLHRSEEFTDDASVVEAMGCSVEMVEGNRENIKITTPFDLKIAETLC